MNKPNYTYKGIVTGVVDGDTLDITIDVGFRITMTQRLRLLRVNTREMHSKDPEERRLAVAAKTYVHERVMGKEIIVTTHKADAFGRYLAEVHYLGMAALWICLNDELLANGLAVTYER